MNLNENIFRAYDIRGIAYEELSEEIVLSIGKALGTKSIRSGQDSLIIARDGRNSSPDLLKWLSKGINSSGCNVIDIGLSLIHI